jgi:hypothetical protein
MRRSIEAVEGSGPLSAAAVSSDRVPGDRDDGAAALQAHVDAFTRALHQLDRDFVRLAGDRLEVSRRIAAELASCRSRDELVALQAAWAEAKSRACLLEARWLVLYADLVRHPEWLARQVEAGKRARFHLVEP